jgi:predicted amidohydrolase
MKIAVGQMAASQDKAENLATIELLVAQAFNAGGVKMIVFPEAAMYTFGNSEETYAAAAEPVTGDFVTKLKHLANLHSMWIVAGMFESSVDANRVYNSVVIIDNQGELKEVYRKIHLYDAFGTKESDRVLAGDGTTVVFQCEDITFGVMTCYDLRFPELARHLAYQGAQAILLPAAWHAGLMKEAHLEILSRARAIESNLYVVVATQIGDRFTGSSAIIDPMGIVQASMAHSEGILLSELDKDRIDAVRSYSPTIKNRRPDVYDRWKEVRWYESHSQT